MKTITLLPGDGIGPEIAASVRKVLAKSSADLKWEVIDYQNLAKERDDFVEKALQSIRKNGAALKGPITTPPGSGMESVTVELRQRLDLFANVRPIRTPPLSRTSNEDLDLIVVRENTEGLYSGFEHSVQDLYSEAIKLTTNKATERIAQFAFEYALDHNRKEVTVVHKANVLQETDGLFLEVASDIADQYPSLEVKDIIVDNLCLQLVQTPEQFDVLLAPNLYGDIIADLSAGLVGGLGLVPGANIGKEYAMFEAAHGSAPDIAGKGVANPAALILSSIMMLNYLGDNQAAGQIQEALYATLKRGDKLTPDLGGSSSLNTFTEAILDNM